MTRIPTPAVPEADGLGAARGGDEDAFRAIVDAYRGQLHAHCYRMLGSVDDAEDALQETFLRAWRGLAAFAGRSSLRTWLYRIATNVCLDARRPGRSLPSGSGRPADLHAEPGEPLAESVWVDPYPRADGRGRPHQGDHGLHQLRPVPAPRASGRGRAGRRRVAQGNSPPGLRPSEAVPPPGGRGRRPSVAVGSGRGAKQQTGRTTREGWPAPWVEQMGCGLPPRPLSPPAAPSSRRTCRRRSPCGGPSRTCRGTPGRRPRAPPCRSWRR